MESGNSPNVLWAPWRMNYILEDKEEGCIFCTKPKQSTDKENLILFRGNHNFVIMNKYPYNNGHLMVVPYKHTREFDALSDAEGLEIMQLLSKSTSILRDFLQADGFNLGMNVGQCAGAGIENHLHFHVVPRWSADTNFMPVLSTTKVISEALEATWKRLHEGFTKGE